MKEIRIGVTGGRDYTNKEHVWSILDMHMRALECLGLKMILVVGDATGVDTFAALWASERDIEADIYAAEWDAHGKAAGPLRNLKMIHSGIDKLCSFPGGRGTEHMTLNCELNGIRVMRYKP